MLRAGGKGTMDQDVTEISFPPMDAQGLVVKYVRSVWVFSQNAEIRLEDFLNFPDSLISNILKSRMIG